MDAFFRVVCGFKNFSVLLLKLEMLFKTFVFDILIFSFPRKEQRVQVP